MVIYLSITATMAHAITIFAGQWNRSLSDSVAITTGPQLQALLFLKGTSADHFTTQNVSQAVRTTRVVGATAEMPTKIRLLSTQAIITDSQNDVLVRDTRSSYAYHPIPENSGASLVFLSRDTNFTYSITGSKEHERFHIHFANCGETADIPLPDTEPWYDAKRVFGASHVPMQQIMLASPAETTLALVRHESFPRITLVQLMQQNATTLSIPMFGPEQLHFSPFFIDDETILFSVIDGMHWGTVRYHLLTGTYEILSDQFTDHAYHSYTGKTILQQSFFNDSINIPFGSIALLEKYQSIPAREIEALIGPKETREHIFNLLFQNPKAARLRFKTDLTTQSFNAIAESDLREMLRTYWLEKQLNLMQSVGAFHLLTVEPDGALAPLSTIPFSISPPATFVQYVEDTEPLLRALELPSTLIEEFRKRRSEAIAAGDFYILVDDLSY